ncbi:MAG: hypothetical protein F4X66_01640 [Chloroflexi bacterium]|nr:hypothetical protein [Chloroflexota bacterium]
MKDTTNPNITNETGDDKPDDPLASYTPQQRRTIIKGLRILARIAVRPYLREQAEQGPLNSGS